MQHYWLKKPLKGWNKTGFFNSYWMCRFLFSTRSFNQASILSWSSFARRESCSIRTNQTLLFKESEYSTLGCMVNVFIPLYCALSSLNIFLLNWFRDEILSRLLLFNSSSDSSSCSCCSFDKSSMAKGLTSSSSLFPKPIWISNLVPPNSKPGRFFSRFLFLRLK